MEQKKYKKNKPETRDRLPTGRGGKRVGKKVGNGNKVAGIRKEWHFSEYIVLNNSDS